MLQEEQGKAPLFPVQNIPIRWKSAYLMVECMVKLKRSIQLYVSDHNDLPTTIITNEWQLSERFLFILKPFFDLTKEMSAEYSILSSMVANIATFELYLSKIWQGDQGVQTTREFLVQALQKWFFSTLEGPNELNIMKDKHYVTSTIIDPRYKNHFFQDSHDKEKAKTWLIEELIKAHKGHPHENLEKVPTSDGNQIDNSSHAGPSSAKKAKPDDLFRACFDEITNLHKAEEATTWNSKQHEDICLVSAAEEVDKFMMLPLLPRTDNPFEWWGKATNFPLLHELARKLLCTPSSSVFSERMYSEYGTSLRRNGADFFVAKERNVYLYITMDEISHFE